MKIQRIRLNKQKRENKMKQQKKIHLKTRQIKLKSQKIRKRKLNKVNKVKKMKNRMILN